MTSELYHQERVTQFKEVHSYIFNFIDVEKQWDMYHTPLSLATAGAIEAIEMAEAVNAEELEKAYEEAIDIYWYAVLYARKQGLDIDVIVADLLSETGKDASGYDQTQLLHMIGTLLKVERDYGERVAAEFIIPILRFVLGFLQVRGIDIMRAAQAKFAKNERKYGGEGNKGVDFQLPLKTDITSPLMQAARELEQVNWLLEKDKIDYLNKVDDLINLIFAQI